MTEWAVDAVFVGALRPLGPRGVPSGIFKQEATGPVAVGTTGLAGDHQGDTRVHGGPEKALHLYPARHYRSWRRELPEKAGSFTAGAFGENLSVSGIGEDDICIGDTLQLGTALVQFSQGRQPCWKLNERFGEKTMAARVQETGRTGWYFRVLKEGTVAAGDRLALMERPQPDWTLARVTGLLYRDMLNYEALAELAENAFLAESWRKLAQRRLERGQVEDWSKRLEGSS
ncbi:MOSC domain-containing protein [Nitratireductor luteus]|uniref:MOSC domain-containing protein n=1 Tax=Nitratireductor luteus TaxID=2976980 RepID=UPI002240608D|nr:MOSC domain-containing protein [Nitratireductor luteus]